MIKLDGKSGGASIGGSITGGTVGSIPFVGTGPVLTQDNSNLFWDNTNKRLGIGTNSPSSQLTTFFSNTSSTVPALNISSNMDNSTNPVFQVTSNGGKFFNTIFSGISNGTNSAMAWGRATLSGDQALMYFSYVSANSASNAINIGFYNNSNIINILNSNKVGINATAPSAYLHITGTTEQLRVGYDLSNYYSTTVSSAGAVTFDAVGASAGFAFSDGVTLSGGTLLTTSAALTNGAAAQTATMTNGPTAGNPTKWIPINDNGTTRYIPAW